MIELVSSNSKLTIVWTRVCCSCSKVYADICTAIKNSSRAGPVVLWTSIHTRNQGICWYSVPITTLLGIRVWLYDVLFKFWSGLILHKKIIDSKVSRCTCCVHDWPCQTKVHLCPSGCDACMTGNHLQLLFQVLRVDPLQTRHDLLQKWVKRRFAEKHHREQSSVYGYEFIAYIARHAWLHKQEHSNIVK